MKLLESIRGVLMRELRTLKRELEAYEDENDIWLIPTGISNSAGTLSLHLLGNLQSFVGAVLGQSGYERDRQAEFSRGDVPRTEILAEIDRTLEVVEETLSALLNESLASPYPLVFGEQRVNTGDFLIHLSTHLSFHLGQIDYHRRLVTGNHHSVSPLAIAELASVTPSV